MIVTLLLDGLSYKVFTEARPKHLWDIASVGYEKEITSSFPTSTGTSHIPFLTGKHCGECDIPGLRWKEGNTTRSYFTFGPTMNHDLKARTIFEEYKTLVLSSPLYQGADKHLIPFGHFISHFTNNWRFFDKLTTKLTKEAIKSNKFEHIFSCFYSIDELSHRKGMKSRQAVDSLKMLDSKAYEIYSLLSDDDVLLIISDHGLSETHTHINLVREIRDRTGLKVKSYPFNIGKSDVFVAETGNAMAHIYYDDPDFLLRALLDIKGVDIATMKGYPNHPQIDKTFLSSRAGDIIVTAEKGYDLRVLEFPEHKASHGSLIDEHMKVPFISNQSDIKISNSSEYYSYLKGGK